MNAMVKQEYKNTFGNHLKNLKDLRESLGQVVAAAYKASAANLVKQAHKKVVDFRNDAKAVRKANDVYANKRQ